MPTGPKRSPRSHSRDQVEAADAIQADLSIHARPLRVERHLVGARAWKASDPSRRRRRQPYAETVGFVTATDLPPLAHSVRATRQTLCGLRDPAEYCHEAFGLGS